MHLERNYSRHTSAEARLIRVGPNNNDSFMQRFFQNAEYKGREAIRNATDPANFRERVLVSKEGKLAAFLQPNILVSPPAPSAINKDNHVDRLKSMTAERRLQELMIFLSEEIPETVRRNNPDLFDPPLHQGDLNIYATDNGNGRIGTLLAALTIMSGESVDPAVHPRAHALAQAALAERNNAAEPPKRMYNLYASWLDAERPGKVDAVTPEYLLRLDSGIPGELRAILTSNIDPLNRKQVLERMYQLYESRQTDINLELAQNRVDHLRLTKSVNEKKLLSETSNFVDNFRNADPRLQIVAAGVGIYVLWKILKAKNPLGRWAAGGLVGYFAYDRFINGNENALNDMAGGLKSFVKFSGGKIKEVAKAAGLPITRNEQDKLNLMGDFLVQNKLPVGPAATGMTALSTVRLGTIADAFLPHSQGNELGGSLSIVDGTSGKESDKKLDPAGNLLYRELMVQMEAMGLKGNEKRATIDYLKQYNKQTGKAVAHIFYMLAGTETRNIERASKIEEALLQYGSYDNLPGALKADYMRLVMEGRSIAVSQYGSQRFVDVVADLNLRKENQRKIKVDTAADIRDPKNPDRADEFAVLELLPNLPVSTTIDEVLKDGGLVDRDCQEFVRNCVQSSILSADGATELAKKFSIIRVSSGSLTEALQIIEKLKYAVFVESTKHEEPLQGSDIILLTGPDGGGAISVLNNITGFFTRFGVSVPGRGFGSISTIADVRSLMTDSWFGSGPLQSEAAILNPLKVKLDVYDKKIGELKNIDLAAARLADSLPPAALTMFGGDRTKLLEFIRPLLNRSNYLTRIDHATAHFSQRSASALIRNMRLNATVMGFGKFDAPGISPIEGGNLGHEMDRLFAEIFADTLKPGTGMWQQTEHVDLLKNTNLTILKGLDYASEAKRMEAIGTARNITVMYLLLTSSGKADAATKKELQERVLTIFEKIVEQKEKDLKAKVKVIPSTINGNEVQEWQLNNLHEALKIENQPSFSEASLSEVENMLRLMEIKPSKPSKFTEMFPENTFPKNLDQVKLLGADFFKEFKYRPLKYWLEFFS